jgi:ribosome-binding protein aMBF1 (putative translation factor)
MKTAFVYAQRWADRNRHCEWDEGSVMDRPSSNTVASNATDNQLAPLVVSASAAGVPRSQVIREYRGLSVEQLARKAGITAADVERLEAGERVLRFSALVAVAAALHVPVQLLVDDQLQSKGDARS